MENSKTPTTPTAPEGPAARTSRRAGHRSRRLRVLRRVSVAALTMVAVAAVATGCSEKKVDTASCKAFAPTAPGRTEVTVTAKKLAFDLDCMKIQPGTLVVTFKNEDKDVVHNFDVKGKGKTKLTAGPDEQVLTLKMDEAGTYNFRCDPHPNMTGAIVVS